MSEIMDILNNFERFITSATFYSPKLSCMSLGLSLSKGTVQISLSPPIPNASTGFAAPGEKRYQHENAYVFGLTPGECFIIIENVNALLNDTYENENDTNPDSKNTLSFMHQTRKIFIQKAEEYKTKQPTLRIAIYDPNNQSGKTTCNYIFRASMGELKIFVEFIKHAVCDLPFFASLITGISKSLKQGEYNRTNNSNESSPQPQSSSDYSGLFSNIPNDTNTKQAPDTNQPNVNWNPGDPLTFGEPSPQHNVDNNQSPAVPTPVETHSTPEPEPTPNQPPVEVGDVNFGF